MNRIIFVPKTWSKRMKSRVRNYFVKRSSRKDFKIIFLEEKIVFKMNYLKRQGQASGLTGPAYWEKWATALGPCGRRDEMKKKM
jgi:hypothetical protein